MARGYQTAKPEYINDYIYQPPWELMQQAAMAKQTQYDNALAQTEMINGLLEIQHINEEGENARVAEDKLYYESKIDDIANEIKSTGNYRKVLPKIRGLQKEIDNSRKSGSIYEYEQSAAMQAKHLKALEEASKSGKEVAAIQQGYNVAMRKWKNQENRSADGVLGFENTIATPDELQSKNIVELAKKVPEWTNSTFTVNPAGGYFVVTNGKTSTVSEDQLLNTIQSSIMSNPDSIAFLQQRQRYEMGTYFNEDGSMIPGYSINITDGEGNKISLEDYEKLPDEDKQKVSVSREFADNSFGNALRLGSSFAYKKDESTSKLQINQVAENQKTRDQQDKLLKSRQDFTRERDAAAHQRKIELKALDPEKGELARAKLEEDLANTVGVNSFAQIAVADVTNVLGLKEKGEFTPAGLVKLDEAFNYFMKDLPDGIEKDAYGAAKELIKNGTLKTTEDINKYIFNVKYPTQEDFIKDDTSFTPQRLEIIQQYEDVLKQRGRMKGESADNIWTGEYKEQLARDFIKLQQSQIRYDKFSQGLELGFLEPEGSIEDYTNDTLFSDKVTEYLNNTYNSAVVEKQFEPFDNAETSKFVTDLVNEHSDEYEFQDSKTRKILVQPTGKNAVPITMTKSRGISGASSRATSHTLFEGSDGNSYIAIPKSDTGTAQLMIKNKALQDLPDESIVKQELLSHTRGQIIREFNKLQTKDGQNPEVEIKDIFYNTEAKIGKINTGINILYTITDPLFGDKQIFPSEREFFFALEDLARYKAAQRKTK